MRGVYLTVGKNKTECEQKVKEDVNKKINEEFRELFIKDIEYIRQVKETDTAVMIS